MLTPRTPEEKAGILACAVFEPYGRIVTETGKARTFEGEENIYTYLGRLVSEGSISDEEMDTVRNNVRDGGEGVLDLSKGKGIYYVYQPLGSDGWYIFNAVSEDYVENRLSGTGKMDPLSTGILAVLALLLLASVGITARNHLIEVRRGRQKYIKACTVDTLTGLYNKTGFERETKKALSRLSPDLACSVISFEVVSFRTYNELYGYEAGDVLLKTIADTILRFKRNGDVVSRLYSDHFVWFTTGGDNEEIFSTIRDALKSANATGLPFFLCAGIYFVDNSEMPVWEMTDKASIAKDTIKYNCSTGVALFNESMLECQLQDAGMVANMMKGLECGEFVEYYQPKYDTHTEKVTGAEALARWKKPDGEIIQPSRFIELFERNGFIRKLDFYIFEKVCEFQASMQAKGVALLPVSVNFSRVHMHDLHFPQRLLNITQKYGIDPKYLEIELTESAFILDAKDQNKIADKLHEYGFSVAIDDFGSGFSSLNMLKDFDADTLKIDTKFLEGFEDGGRVGTVVTSVIRLAKWLGISVVAEGVETRDQVDFLHSLGCETIQGYYYSRPIPRDDYEKLIIGQSGETLRSQKSAGITLSSINAALGGDGLINSLLDGILGGFGIYELTGEKLEVIRANRTYYEMMGYKDLSSFREDSLNVIDRICLPDRERVIDACRRAVASGSAQKLTACRYRPDESILSFDAVVRHIGGTQNRPLLCMSLADSAEKLLADRENERNKYSDALYSIFDEIYEFNYAEDTFRVLSHNYVRCREDTKSLAEREKNWIENIVYSEDRKRIRQYVAMARSGGIRLPFSTEYRTVKKGEIRWKTASLVSIAGGSYLICELDVTQIKQYEALMVSFEPDTPVI
ncbi:MAG: EAL domain-containing protein [Oscillospiraceae bacterium]|nr:EAL domain-containing protein [Oscillospiraceae bacterium]